MKFSIVELKTEELEQLVDLFILVWKNNRLEVSEKTSWAFNNSFSKILVAKNEENQLIGARGGINWPLVFHNKELNCYQFHGTCVHPNYRRQGLFSLMNKEFLKISKLNEIEFIFNVSVKASRLGYENLGWKYLKGLHRLTKFHMKYFSLNSSNINNDFGGNENILVPEEFYQAREEQFKNLIHTRYDETFLNWRLNNKSANYKIYKTSNAIIIYKTRINNDKKELIIGDFFLKRGKYSEFSSALRILIKKELPSVSYTYIFNTHPYYMYYLRFFFLPNPLHYNLNFGVRNINDKNDILKNKWGISFLDIDTF